MKKQEKSAGPGSRPGSATSGGGGGAGGGGGSSVMGMKHSKSDHSTLAGSRGGAGGRGVKEGGPGGKKYLSKSHENLAGQGDGGEGKLSVPPSPASAPKSQQQGQQQQQQQQQGSSAGPRAGGSSSRPSSADKNKENMAVQDKERNSGGFVKPKQPKSAGLTTIRKASSTQSIDKTAAGGSSSSGGSLNAKTNTTNSRVLSMKRAQSTQNVSKDKLTRKRTSAPTDVMAYNAELLANFEKEKKNLESRISELTKITESRKAEIERYKFEIRRLKEHIPAQDVREELEFLRNQNRQLQDRLKELGIPVEQITDSEKLMLKKSSGASSNNGRSGTRANEGGSDICLPNSLSCDSLSTDGARGGGGGGGGRLGNMERSVSMSASEPGLSLADLCGTPDHPSVLSLDHSNWDKQSQKSNHSDGLSELSVACLTERIQQMEETNYSTTEELQATLQELGDLQDAVNELTEENERFADEKSVLLESLCTQTEKLEKLRLQIEQMKILLVKGDLPNKGEREQALMELLNSSTEEREEMLRKQDELVNELHLTHAELRELQDRADEARQLREQAKELTARREAQDAAIAEMREAATKDQIEIAKLRAQLEHERTKLSELEQLQKAADKSALESLLETTRQEKARVEQRLGDLQELHARSQKETAKLHEQLEAQEEELKVARNKAKLQISDLECEQQRLEKDRGDKQQEIDALREHIDQLTHDCDGYLKEKQSYAAQVTELQLEVKNVRQAKAMLELDMADMKSKHCQDEAEWKQFQKDLQVAVVIANDFRAETLENMEKLKMDCAQYKEHCAQLEEELAAARSELGALRAAGPKGLEGTPISKTPSTILSSAELKGKVMSAFDRDVTALREGRRLDARNQSLSVKSLIRSIEEQVKSGCSSLHSSHSNSRRNSDSTDSSLSAFQDLVKSPTSPSGAESPLSPSSSDIRFVLRRSSDKTSPHPRHPSGSLSFGDKQRSPSEPPKASPQFLRGESEGGKVGPSLTSILQTRTTPRRNSGANVDKESASRDHLAQLAKQMGGSKRNALLKWCQNKALTYSGVDITNFSSSWNDGLAFCALIHSYLPDKIPYEELNSDDKRRNFTLAFNAAESVGIPSTLNINDMVAMERPDWQAVMAYITSIYKHFEVDSRS